MRTRPSARKQQTGERLDRRRSLAGIPVLNADVTADRGDERRLTLTIRTKRREKGLLSRFQPAVMTRRLKLDELGSFVLSRIDGESDVMCIVDAFVTCYQVNRREAELSIVEFLKSLARRNVISIVIE